jgi:hypothetical protein
MPGLEFMSVVGVVVLAVLFVVFMKMRQRDIIEALMKKRSGDSKVVTRAEYVEGMNTIPVAMSLRQETFYYENPDLEASFDLDRIDEIEYAEELAIGRPVHAGKHVLRLRSHGTTFEFVLDSADEKKWVAALPPRRVGAQAV